MKISALVAGVCLLAAGSALAQLPPPAAGAACPATATPVGRQCVGLSAHLRMLEFTGQMLDQLNRRDVVLIQERFHVERFLIYAARGAEALSPQLRSSFEDGVRKSMGNLSEQWRQQIPEGTRFRFLRLRDVYSEEGPRISALYRVEAPEGGLNYLELFLFDDGSKVWIDDTLYHTRGFRNSKLVNGFLRQALAVAVPNTFKDRLAAMSLSMFIDAYRKADYARVVRDYVTLPESLKAEPLLAHLYAEAASMRDETTYSNALGDIAQRFSNDPSFALRLLDYHFEHRDFKRALESVDLMERNIGDDAGIEFQRATLLMEMGDYPGGIASARKAIGNDPDYLLAYWTLLSALARSGRYEDAVLTMQVLEARFGIAFEPEKVRGNADFGGLGESEAFRAWMAEQ